MNDWIEKYERAGWLGRVGLLGGGAVRLAARAIDVGIDRAAAITVEARQAFERELDPNMTDAQVVEESDEPFGQNEPPHWRTPSDPPPS